MTKITTPMLRELRTLRHAVAQPFVPDCTVASALEDVIKQLDGLSESLFELKVCVHSLRDLYNGECHDAG